MFRQILVESARMLGMFAGTIGMLSVHVKTLNVGLNTRFGRHWESNTSERQFDRQLVERRAFNEFGSRLPLAR
jgi:hypothetical protein